MGKIPLKVSSAIYNAWNVKKESDKAVEAINDTLRSLPDSGLRELVRPKDGPTTKEKIAQARYYLAIQRLEEQEAFAATLATKAGVLEAKAELKFFNTVERLLPGANLEYLSAYSMKVSTEDDFIILD